MPRQMIRRSLCVGLLVGNLVLGCQHSSLSVEPPPDLGPSFPLHLVSCGPSLTRDQILSIAERASFPKLHRTPAEAFRDFDISIYEDGCNYVFVASTHEPLAVEPISLTIDRFGRVVSPFECCWLGTCPWWCSDPPKELPLSSLSTGCHVVPRTSDPGSHSPFDAWLSCDGAPATLITNPLNLLGKVKIRSEAQALEFVRFFSSPQNHDMFGLGRFIELTTSQDYWGQNLVHLLRLDREFFRPLVDSVDVNGFCRDRAGIPSPCTLKQYSVRRLVILGDGVYEIQERVTAEGFYQLDSVRLVLDHLGRFGPFFQYAQ